MISGVKRIVALLSCLAVLGAPARAKEPAFDLAQLMAQLAQVKSARAHFTERREMAILNAPLVSSGTLSYVAPDQLVKHTLQPRFEKLTVRGDLVTVQRDRKKLRALSLSDSPELKAIIASIRATLAGDAGTLAQYYDVALNGDEASWELDLAPRLANLQAVLTSIRIAGSGALVHRIETTEKNGDRTVTTITPDVP